MAFAHTITSLLHDQQEVLYFDSCSLDIWERASKVWQPMDAKLYFELPASKGASFTVLGAISSRAPVFFFRVADTTNWETVSAFIKQDVPEKEEIRFF